ncbi:MAG: 16S rRNA (guanine(966)-N(2))-methyltransferase RsmD [Succinivibrionaceae bacterium]
MGNIRIIGGRFRGRKLPVLDAEGLRPTTDRVRETVFNWLQFDIPGTRCLDVFAGTGALSMEALSRGAVSADLIELNSLSARQLKNNASLLQLTSCRIFNLDALKFLSAKNSGECYDLVFLDPPYHRGLLDQAAELLDKNGYLGANALIYVEYAENEEVMLPVSWTLKKSKIAGQCCYNLYQVQSS